MLSLKDYKKIEVMEIKQNDHLKMPYELSF